MPHLLLSNHTTPSMPDSLDGVGFKFIAHSSKEDKIMVEVDNKKFLLTLKKPKDDSVLLKIDPTTRVTPVSLVKKALNTYAKFANAQILFSNTNENSAKLEPQKEYLKDIEYFVDEFQTDKEIFVEVGFGSGRHLIHQALENPDKIIIGLEIHTPSIEQMLKQVKLQNITNIIAVNYDARLFLEFLNSNSVSRIFVHFPVPWDKKPHRRVMSIEFIEQSLRALKPGGTLELRTDSPNYYEYSKGLLEHFNENQSTIIKNQDLKVTSKYETRWKKQGKDIWDVIITSNKIDGNIDNNYDFGFINSIDINKLNLEFKPIVKKDFFVHFDDIYKIDDKSALIQLTMGSFNKPVSKYIVVENGKASYLQGAPLPTSANFHAHKLVEELLK